MSSEIVEFLLDNLREDERVVTPDQPRALAEVRAKLDIVCKGRGWVEMLDETISSQMANAVYTDVFKALARIYQDRPGFQPEWRS